MGQQSAKTRFLLLVTFSPPWIFAGRHFYAIWFGGDLNGQAMSTPIQFTNVTAAAGIKFVHFRGNDGIPINREIFGPGFASQISMATAILISIS